VEIFLPVAQDRDYLIPGAGLNFLTDIMLFAIARFY
jgi:hypothetical protein